MSNEPETKNTDLAVVHPTTKALIDNVMVLLTPDGFQKYVLGTKSNGTPRAVYDVVKDYHKPKKKKKKKKKSSNDDSAYGFYIKTKKKKKKKKSKKHWNINDY